MVYPGMRDVHPMVHPMVYPGMRDILPMVHPVVYPGMRELHLWYTLWYTRVGRRDTSAQRDLLLWEIRDHEAHSGPCSPVWFTLVRVNVVNSRSVLCSCAFCSGFKAGLCRFSSRVIKVD